MVASECVRCRMGGFDVMAKAVPQGLDEAGSGLWEAILSDLPENWELDQRESALLLAACRQLDDVARLEAVIEREGVTAVGSTGQPTVHPAVVEARQGRTTVARLLGQIELPDAEENPQTAAGLRAKRAAQIRWAAQERKKEVA